MGTPSAYRPWGARLTFDSTYRSNPLVNVFCLGVLPISRLVLASASGVGNLAVLLGSATGRDGIGGVSVLASAGFAEKGAAEESAKRPSVQISDPYEEKRLIEACLELLEAGLVVGIQDLGGAGLSCATSETAARAGLGMDVDVSRVPRREPMMSPVEVMTSESQERMLAIVEPGSLAAVEEVCRRWEVEATAIGVVTAPDASGVGRLRIIDGATGEVAADVPASSLADDAPRYERPLAPPADLTARRFDDPSRLPRARRSRRGPAVAALGPGARLPAVRPPTVPQHRHRPWRGRRHGAQARRAGNPLGRARRLAMSADGNPGWCAVDPRSGTAATVAESALNVSCAGAIPLALVNCLNFGNPEHPEVMWQLSEAIDGMAEACEALAIPVVGWQRLPLRRVRRAGHRSDPGRRGRRVGRASRAQAAGARLARRRLTRPRRAGGSRARRVPLGAVRRRLLRRRPHAGRSRGAPGAVPVGP